MPYIPICLYYFLFLCFYFHLLFHYLLATTNILQFTIFDSISLQPALNIWSSLIYSTSAWHKRHECNTTATLATRVRHKCDTSATWTTRVQHEWYTNDTSATRVKNFDFDNDTSKNIFSHHCIYYMASERLQGEEQFHSKNYLLEMSRFHAKMRLKSAPQKLNFLIAKAISKPCTLDCSCKCHCTFPHSYAE